LRRLLAARVESSEPVNVLDETERQQLKEQAYDLMDTLGITSGRVRDEMARDPEKAVAILQAVMTTRGLYNPAGAAIHKWEHRGEHRPRPKPPEPDIVEGLPSLSALEYAWSLMPGTAPVVRMIAAALGRSDNGCRELLNGWWQRERYDSEGNLERVQTQPPH
jgi:hypothetical protein